MSKRVVPSAPRRRYYRHAAAPNETLVLALFLITFLIIIGVGYLILITPLVHP